MQDEISDKLMRLEEHQLFLERQVEQLAAEVLELSQLLRVTQNELKRLQAEAGEPKADLPASDQQAGS